MDYVIGYGSMLLLIWAMVSMGWMIVGLALFSINTIVRIVSGDKHRLLSENFFIRYSIIGNYIMLQSNKKLDKKNDNKGT